MSTIKHYLSLVKFSHTIFAMPFALIGFFLAVSTNIKIRILDKGQWNLNEARGWGEGAFDRYNSEEIIFRFTLVLLCMIFARSAAMAFNRYLDRKWDALNPRTAIREIPKGIITPKNALTFTIASCLVFIAATFFINRLCFYLSPVALAVVLGY